MWAKTMSGTAEAVDHAPPLDAALENASWGGERQRQPIGEVGHRSEIVVAGTGQMGIGPGSLAGVSAMVARSTGSRQHLSKIPFVTINQSQSTSAGPVLTNTARGGWRCCPFQATVRGSWGCVMPARSTIA